MRKFKFTLIAFMAAMMALSFTACSDDDPEPNPNPDPEVNEDNYHFDPICHRRQTRWDE